MKRQSTPSTKISSFDDSIIINFYPATYRFKAEGWYLSKNGVHGSPLELIENPEIRKLVMAEASSLVWSKAHEFKVGDTVTFQAYRENEPLLRTVLKVSEYNFLGEKDGQIYYHLGFTTNVTTITTGKSIIESKLFDLN